MKSTKYLPFVLYHAVETRKPFHAQHHVKNCGMEKRSRVLKKAAERHK